MPANPNERILALVAKRGAVSTTDVARALRVTRQAAHRRLTALAAEGSVVHQGAGRGARWVLPSAVKLAFTYATAGLEEDKVWEELVRKISALATLPAPAGRVASYAFTEMLNNAIDHSGSDRVDVVVDHDARSVTFEIRDDGVGAFENVRATLGLASALEGLQELSKGKTTTMPERHAGEGIFFTSKAAERFELESNGIEWIVDNARGDFTVTSREPVPGTRVRCVVAFEPAKSLAELFAEFTDDFEFSRTRTVVRLFAIGVEFVSRSEARRLLHGLEKFREVELDFTGVTSIGQGFADEVFRVWARAHPATRFVTTNAAGVVDFMIRRALATA